VDPETHRQRQKWFSGFATRKEAEQFRLTLAHHPSFAGGVGPYGSPRLRTGDYLDSWVDEREALRQIRPNTAAGYHDLCQRHVIPAIGHIPLARLGPAAVQHLYAALLDRGLAPATVRQVAAIIHAALGSAVRSGLVLRNPADNTTPPSVLEYQPVVWTPEQLGVYLEDACCTATPSVYALYVSAAGTGARIGELCGAPEDAVDLRARLLHVHRTLVAAGADPTFGQPKTGRGRRSVLLPLEAVEVVRVALMWKKERKLRLGPKFHDGGTLFCTPSGRPIDRRVLRARDHLPRIKRLGLPVIRLHDFRHMHATYLIAAGVDSRTVADRLGHTDPGFLTRTYAHAVARAQEQAAAVANEMLTKTGHVSR
jgi:integrase